MAIKLIANYSKRLGLPGYSSHQFSVELEAELPADGDISEEAARLYQLLQQSVDSQIQSPGFVPTSEGGGGSGEHRAGVETSTASFGWCCTPKQRQFIENYVAEHQIDKREVEALAHEQCSKGVRLLDKQQASQLIAALTNPQFSKRSGVITTRAA